MNEHDDLDVGEDPDDFEVGERYLIQTATLWLFLGECSRVTDSHVWFEQVSWVQELGRFSEFSRSDGATTKYSEHGGPRVLRVAKKHVVFDVLVANVPRTSINNGNPE